MIYENKCETTDIKVCVKLTKTFIFLHISQNEHIIAKQQKLMRNKDIRLISNSKGHETQQVGWGQIDLVDTYTESTNKGVN